MRVVRRGDGRDGRPRVAVLDDQGQEVAPVSGFLRYLAGRDCSPHTQTAYAHDLLHLLRFLAQHDLSLADFSPRWSVEFLAYLRAVPSARRTRRSALVLTIAEMSGASATHLAPATINRILSAVSSLYEYLIVTEAYAGPDNPIATRPDPAFARVADRHRPFMGTASRQRPVRRLVRVKTVLRIPRPIPDDQVARLVDAPRRLRDRAILLLMLHGGLRPGEVLNLRLEDIAYGRRRVTVRFRDDHPRGARTKSRRERVVDLFEPVVLETVSAYVMRERPRGTGSPYLFLVGGHGKRAAEPLGYQAVHKMFVRQCERLGLRTPWLTLHALRHTHATRMWEGGMRELTLGKRLGHASAGSTALYTRVSDAQVVREYRQALGHGADR